METWFLIILVLLIISLCAFVYMVRVVYRQQLQPLSYDVYLEHINTVQLGPYYVSLSNKLNEKFDQVDEQGGPVMLGADGRMHYAPIKHAHKALTNYEAYFNTGEQKYCEIFLETVDSIIAHGKDGVANSWIYEHYCAHYAGQQVPWLHAMAQGQIIALLCRAYVVTNDDRFLTFAKRAVIPFTRDVKDGGVRSVDPVRGIFYEEYAFHEDNKQHHTLNGMMSALMGVFDLWKTTQEQAYKKIFDDGITTIRNNLMSYDYPFCSSYDLRFEHGQSPVMQPRYNSVHVAHLKIMAVFTNDPFFNLVSEKWSQKFDSRFNRWCYFLFYLDWKCHDLCNDFSNIGIIEMLRVYRIRLMKRILNRKISHNAVRSNKGV